MHPFLIIASAWRLFWHACTQWVLALNQFVHMTLGLFLPWSWRTMWSDETMSSRAWRSEQRGKRTAKIMRPLIDALFWWQEIDPRYTGHCHQAWARERSEEWKPPEQRSIEKEARP